MAPDVVAAARDRGLFTTITLATSFGCPFEGEVDPARVAEFARPRADSGVQELRLADTGRRRPARSSTSRRAPATWSATGWRCASTSTTPRTSASPTSRGRRGEGVDVLDASAGGIGAARSRRRRRQHRHGRPRLHAGTDGRPTGIDPTTPCRPRGSCPSSSATRCPPPPRWAFVSDCELNRRQAREGVADAKLRRSHLTAGELSPGPTSPSPSTRS